MELNGKQRKALRGMAHGLPVVVTVGHAGLEGGVLAALEQALLDHELVKVRFSDFKEERRDLTEQMAEATGAAVCGLLGHTAILFRPHPDPEQRRISVD